MTTESQPRPYRAAAIIGLVAQLLFTFRLTTPHKLVFDETHYVAAARVLMELSGPSNIEHPLLGKELIALGMLIFGDNSLGWRIMSTFAATAVVLGIFAILWLLFGRVRTAVIGALCVLLNITVFIQARIGMLDGFMAALCRHGHRGAALGDARTAGQDLAALAARLGTARAWRWARNGRPCRTSPMRRSRLSRSGCATGRRASGRSMPRSIRATRPIGRACPWCRRCSRSAW